MMVDGGKWWRAGSDNIVLVGWVVIIINCWLDVNVIFFCCFVFFDCNATGQKACDFAGETNSDYFSDGAEQLSVRFYLLY